MQTERMSTGGYVHEHGNRRWRGSALEKRETGLAKAAPTPERSARALGWFSVGLGVMQLLAPRGMARFIGARPSSSARVTMFLVGLREITCGIGLLTKRRPTAFAWMRVAGDLMDLALLGGAMGSRRADRPRLLAATAAVAGVTVADTAAAIQLAALEKNEQGGVRVTRAITINRSREDVYRFWRDFQNLPHFMAHLESVQAQDGHSRWRARMPVGPVLEWEAELTADQPNEYIAWRSTEGSKIANRGSVRFRPGAGGRGTEVHLELTYDPPGGALGASMAKLFGAVPAMQIGQDLRRLKQLLETGEVVHSDASIHRGPHPAQPPERVGHLGIGGGR